MMRVELKWYEQHMAAQVGMLRHFQAVRKARVPGYGFTGDGLAVHIDGAMGEVAVAKALNLYWSGAVDTFKTGDVGPLHVRTRSRAYYELNIRDDDPDRAPFVLVRGKRGQYDLVGWFWSQDARRPEWRHNYGNRDPAYFVPDTALRPMSTLLVTP